ncbi:MAG: hypothetical protein GX785_03065 [Armatimonadetes bacterium]|jgi:hypothetical protein|nr:hypothetical protein [Armatimonadota bacterium]HOM82635.1 hypothetical protein [Armatimonadota bacterium]HPO72124.1 hypothetical protein [Armatimonadota bacterium]
MHNSTPAGRAAAGASSVVRVLLASMLLFGNQAHADEPLLLRYRLQEGERSAYTREATITATFQVQPGSSSPVTLRLRAEIRGITTQEVRNLLPDGSYRILEQHRLQLRLNGCPIPIPAIGPTESRLSPLGVRDGPSSGLLADWLPFGLGGPTCAPGVLLQFPPDPVRVGARWHTYAEWMLPGEQEAMTAATARLLGIAEHAGRPCARIRTQVTIPPLRLRAPSEKGAGSLEVWGTATGEALHDLHTGEPLYSRVRLRLQGEVEGVSIAGDPPATGSGEAEILLESRRVASTRIQPARPPAPEGQEAGLHIHRPASGERVTGELDVDCRVSIPEARYMVLRIDGIPCAAINHPYQHRIDLRHLSAGEHLLEVELYSEAGELLAQARQVFIIAGEE